MARKKKPASGKKKRSRKKKKKDSGNAAAGEVATPAVPDPGADEASLVELGADEQPEPAAVDLHADEPRDEPPAVDLHADEPRDEVPVIDLDAEEPPVVDLDDDGDADELVAALIAEAVATAPPDEEPDEPEPPVIDLDAEVEAGPPDDAATADDAEHAPPTPAVRDVEATGGAAADSLDARSAAPGELTPEEVIRQLIDLGPVSSSEIRERLLAEALAHAQHKDARYRVPFSETPAAGRWKALAGLVILLVAGLVALAPPGWARPQPPAQLATAERARGLRVALLLQAEQVEAFRVREQRLPATLEEVAEALPGVRYVRSGTRAYQLIAYLPEGSAVVYDSGSPTEAFEVLEPGWRPEGGAP